MIRVLTILFALLVGLAGTIDGQGRGAPSRGDDPGPVAILMRIRGELALTDDQVTRLQRIEADTDRLNHPLFAKMREIRGQIRDLGDLDDLQGDRRELFQSHVGEARAVMEKIRHNNRIGMERVGEVLTDSQKASLSKLLREMGDNRERSGDNARVRGG